MGCTGVGYLCSRSVNYIRYGDAPLALLGVNSEFAKRAFINAGERGALLEMSYDRVVLGSATGYVAGRWLFRVVGVRKEYRRGLLGP